VTEAPRLRARLGTELRKLSGARRAGIVASAFLLVASLAWAAAWALEARTEAMPRGSAGAALDAGDAAAQERAGPSGSAAPGGQMGSTGSAAPGGRTGSTGSAAPGGRTGSTGSAASGGSGSADPAARRLAVAASLERALSRKVLDLLAPVVGTGRVVARVHADLDWTERAETREQYDPGDPVLRREERVRERGEGGATRSEESLRYEVGRRLVEESRAAGVPRRLDVAVLVDAEAPLAGDAGTLARLEELARHAVGLDEARGDSLTLAVVPFAAVEPAWVPTPPLLAGLALAALAAIALAAWLWRRGDAAAEVDAGLPVRAGRLEASLVGEPVAAGPPVPGEPEEAAELLRRWLEEE